MSLDVYLEDPTATYETETLYEANITHNMNKMADKAGIYQHLWEPEQISITTAKQLISPLKKGLEDLKSRPDYYKTFVPENGWGSYDGFIKWIQDYLSACIEYPEAKVRVWV